ncbi:MAG TPA: hypothetical protein PK299_00955 [Anaerolineales bacterium]|nr:hypothetical protein [Anaerolineales bacterium]
MFLPSGFLRLPSHKLNFPSEPKPPNGMSLPQGFSPDRVTVIKAATV